MYVFKSDQPLEAYIELLNTIIKEGELEAKTRDLTNVNITLTNPANSFTYYRKNWKWAFKELFDRMSPLYTADSAHWNPGTAYVHRPAWKKKLEKEGGEFHYTYGQHYKDQVQAVIKLLSSKKTDREGIVTVWDQRYLLSRDNYNRRPCTLHLHFFRRDDKLNMNLSMRSNDVINLLPYDIFHHSFLQRYIALHLGIELGYYSHTASHVYYPKRRESKGRNYFNNIFPKLKHNLEATKNLELTPLGTIEQVNSSFIAYYAGSRNPNVYPSPFMRNMIHYLRGEKINEFKFL